MIKNYCLIFSCLISLTSSLVATKTDHEKLLAAIKSGDQDAVLKHIETREKQKQTPKTRDISALLSAAEKGLPQAEIVVNDTGKAAQIVSAVAAASGNLPAASVAGGVAAAANILEPIMEAVASGNTLNEDSALLQAAQETEQIALANSGLKSRLLSAFVAAGCATFIGVKIWADCFSTENDTADKRAAALTTDSGVIFSAGSIGLGGLYYAVTNKYNNDAQTQAKMITRVVSAHTKQK